MNDRMYIASLEGTLEWYEGILKQYRVILGILIVTVVLFITSIPISIAVIEAKASNDIPLYRIRRTLDEEAGVLCYTAHTQHSLSTSCIPIKDTKLKEANDGR